MISPDLSQYLGVFLDEGLEQLDLLESYLLAMEREGASEEALQAMFRAAHTLKGSSRTMGFSRIGDLTHEMENVLDDLRNNRLTFGVDLVSLLLECVDVLKAMLAEVQANSTDEGAAVEPVIELVGRLAVARGGSAPDSPAMPAVSANQTWSVAALNALPLVIEEGQRGLDVRVTFREDCLMKSIRAMMVLASIREQAAVVATLPEEEKLEAEEFELDFRVLLATDLEPAALQGMLMTLSEVAAIEITEPGAKEELVEAKEKAPTRESAPAAQTSTGTIRVAISHLDALLNLVGELVIDRSQISRIASALEDKHGATELISQLGEATHRIARIAGELQDEIMKTRLLPVDGVFQRMPRMVRDLAEKTGKDVDLVITGGETELDRSLLDVISDPIIHLLRNSLDHGIESPAERVEKGKPARGTVTLAARHEENHIVIEISDDGRGIDPVKLRAAAVQKGVLNAAQADALTDGEAIKLIFASGFSTAQQLSDISGRGVGMDIVRANIEKIGGRIQLDSKVGEGSRFQIHLPLTLAIVRALLVEAGTATYAIPLATVVETVKLGATYKRETIAGKAALVLRGETVPLNHLLSILEADPEAGSLSNVPEDGKVVVVGFAEKKVGLCVDKLIGEQEVVIKPLGKLLGDVHGIAGASILGDGRVALIVDAARAVVG